MYDHQKDCSGPVKSREEGLEDKIEELNQKLEDSLAPSTSETVETITPVGYGKLADCIRPRLYFGLPGDLLIPLIPTEYFIIKVGSTKEPGTRWARHSKDYGGFQMLDSIVTSNCSAVEEKLRDWLRFDGRLMKAQIMRSRSDTEIFVVKNQKEYETIVKIAKVFSEELEAASQDQSRKEMEWQKEKLEYEKRCSPFHFWHLPKTGLPRQSSFSCHWHEKWKEADGEGAFASSDVMGYVLFASL